jgi:hypothetical protein
LAFEFSISADDLAAPLRSNFQLCSAADRRVS